MRDGPADQLILHSGCFPNEIGNVTCSPEAMRASAARQLQQSGFWPSGKPLDLATYTLARNMHSEQGNGSVEDRVVVGESTVNQGKLQGASTPQEAVLNTALFRQPSHLYGQINAPSGASLRSGRFTSTSQDPSVLTTLLADLVITGQTDNFAQGADDQDGLASERSFTSGAMARVLQYARNKSYWVGPLPGVDHWSVAAFRNFGIPADTIQGQVLIARAQAVFGQPIAHPVWPADLPICTTTASEVSDDGFKKFALGFAALAGLFGLGWLALRVARSAATGTPLLGTRRR